MKKKGAKLIIKKGDIFNDWTAISEDYTEYTSSGALVTFVKVRCKCGYEKISRKYSIEHGVIGKCRSCKKKEGFNNGRFKGYEDLGGYHLNQIQRSAKKRKLEYIVSAEYLWKLLESQNFKCALTGETIMLSRTIDNKTKIQTGSLDRIDNSKGYIEGNVRWVHKIINQMRSNRTDKEFIEWCVKVYKHNKLK